MLKTKKLKIGYKMYTVRENSKALDELNQHGRCHQDKCWIEYTTSYPPWETVDTVIHEVLHALWDLHIGDEEELTEERCVTMLAHGITQVMRDNPKFIKELQDML